MTRTRPLAALAALLPLLLLVPPAAAVSGGKSDDEGDRAAGAEAPASDEAKQAYERGMELVKEGHWQDALERFRAAAKKDRKNPEYLNMVAYTLRKVGNLDDAFETYAKVLAMKPNYAPAREYLGEAHLQAILLQLDVLRGYGDDGRKEYDALVTALRKAAETLAAEPMGGPFVAPDEKGW